MSDAAPAAMTELKVSAHLMTLSEGVFCVYNTPGTAAAPSATGMPGVRISPAPAAPQGAGTVAITGFGGDGWLGGQEVAALIRVSGGPAPVLVTVYQDMDTSHPAPKLQVIRLSDAAPGAEVAAHMPAQAPEPPAGPEPAPSQQDLSQQAIEVAAHIYGLGDVGGRLGQWMGQPGSKRWIEGFGMAPNAGIIASDLEYQAVLGRGWLSPWSEGGQFCGSRGMSLPILGLRVRLRGAAADQYQAKVEATFVDGSTVGPVGAGEACEAPSLAALEAFRVSFIRQGTGQGTDKAAGPAAARPSRKAAAPKAAPAPATPPAPKARAKVAHAKPAAPSTPVATAKPKAPARSGKDGPAAKPVKRTPATTRRR